jgi:hypothetical protein
MNLNAFGDDFLAARDIRRYPSEIDRVPNRGTAQNAEVGRNLTFSEVAADLGRTNSADLASAEPQAAKSGKPFSLWENGEFGFADFIDIINPLQHIPIVATIYRNLSGDQIGAAPRVIGGALWGRLGGFVAGVVNAFVEWWSGKDIGDHIYTAIFGPSEKVPSATAVAQKKLPPSQAAPSGLGVREATAPRSEDTAITTTVKTPPAALPESEVTIPDALRSKISPILAPAARTAFSSYETILGWSEVEESWRVRFPA